VQKQSIDSIVPGFVEKMQQFAKETRTKSAKERESDRSALLQDALFENLKKTMQRTKTYLKNGIDTTGISHDLSNIIRWHTLAVDGMFATRGTSHTFRNLTTTYNLLLVLEKELLGRKVTLDNVQRRLSSFRFQIDSLGSDSSLYAFSNDSATLMIYLRELSAMAHQIDPVDSMLKKAIANVRTLQTSVNVQVYRIASSKDEIEQYQREVYRNTLRREFPDIWQPVSHGRTFREIVAYSKAKGQLTLRFYAESNLWKISFLLLLILIATFYLLSLRKVYRQRGLLDPRLDDQLVLQYPVLSSMIIVLNVFQFLFPAPPFVFNAILWPVSAIALTIVFRNFISRYWLGVWLTFLALFLLASGDNLLLQASGKERWGMLLLALTGVAVGLASLIKGKRNELKEQWILYSIGLAVVLESASVVANCYGRYDLAKTLLISGYSNIVTAILFLWTVRLINEGLTLASKVYAGQDIKLFYINFERVGKRAHPLFYIFMVAGWFILFGRHFYAFNLLSAPVKDFLSGERQVGDYTFSINTLLLFVFIMLLSVIASRIVSYFASDKHLAGTGIAAREEKNRLGSWLLLIRISIITLGLFFAFAAAGIPMDKIAIILGALGVGIGFGLQTLVNNLVSGLIIAFEKPVNVGDVVEVDNQAGTMKSIGFRSSVISTWDGADLVMPNGDLLSSHLINWTLGGNKRRMNLVLGVAYETDLERTREILQDLMNHDERIVKYPVPMVLFQEFGSSSIDVKLFFWVRHLRDGFPAKSDLIVAINKAFKQNNITIPFPQQDIHIRNAGEIIEKRNDGDSTTQVTGKK